MASSTSYAIVFAAGVAALGLGLAFGRGEEKLDADFWRQRVEQTRRGAALAVQQTCGRANPPARRARRPSRG